MIYQTFPIDKLHIFYFYFARLPRILIFKHSKNKLSILNPFFCTLTVLQSGNKMDFLFQIGVVIGIGLMIGLEREYSIQRDNDEIFAGARTFPLVALLGFLSGMLTDSISFWVLVTSFAGVIALVTISYHALTKKNEIGATTEISFLITFILGVLVFAGKVQEAVTSAVLVTLLLSLKFQFKDLLGRFSKKDYLDLVKFVIIASVILPILPDSKFGPYGILNPKEIWFVIVLISGVSFAGFIVTKLIGTQKGILVTGFVGGFVSSTVIAWDFSAKSKLDGQNSNLYAAGIILASTVMFLRILVLIFILNLELGKMLTFPALILFFTGLIFCYFLTKRKSDGTEISNLKFSNPLNLKKAILLTLFFVALQMIVQFVKEESRKSGIFLISGISGLLDLDAISLTLSKFGSDSETVRNSSVAVLIAVLSNTFFKLSIAVYKGHNELRKPIFLGFGSMIMAGLACIFFILF